MPKKELLGFSTSCLAELFSALGEPPYRARQLYHALYRERQWDVSKITAFPRALRSRLQEQFQITIPETQFKYQSADGTSRYLLRLSDGREVETVWIPDRKRRTICISTQVGCAVDCKFCLTGLLGLVRNLTPGEIVGQVLLLVRDYGVTAGDRLNLVFMGMGEPFLNYENVLEAVRLLADPDGFGLSWTRMTLSTSGIVSGMEKFGQEPVRTKLAISLNATTDDQRNQLMPINRKWPLAELLDACRRFPLRPREKLTFEYVLLDGLNDAVEDAVRLGSLLRGISCKVNLIGWNPGPELAFHTPPDERIFQFQRTVIAQGLSAFIRKPHGRDIFGACGQLKLTTTPPVLAVPSGAL